MYYLMATGADASVKDDYGDDDGDVQLSHAAH